MQQRLRRSLGFPTLLIQGVGVTVGAGIYSILGAAAGEAGHAVWLSLAIAAVPALLTGLCYAELCTMFPRAGAAAAYVREAVPGRPWASFITGYLVLITAAATAATVATAFSGYLSPLIAIPSWIGAAMLLTACTLLNLVGIREAAWAAILCTSIEVIGLVMIIFAGFRLGSSTQSAMEIDASSALIAAALSFFVYTGFESLANLAEETRRPERSLPPAILLSLVITAVLYVLVGLAAVRLVSPSELEQSDAPLATAAQAADPRLASALAWIGLFSTANTALITLVAASRMLYGMADAGQMPGVFRRVLPGRKTPWAAALAMSAAAALFLPLGPVEIIGSISSLTTLIVFLAVNLALIVIRVRRPKLVSPFRVPLRVGNVPLIPVAGILSILLLAAQFEPAVYAWSAAGLGSGILLYLTRRWWPVKVHAGERT